MSLQVCHRDEVAIHDADMSHSRRSEIHRHGRTQTAGTHHEHLGIEKAPLAVTPHSVEDDVSVVAASLF